MRLGLGTVQFGLPYGVTNKSGVPGREAVSEILALARDGDVDLIDTAAGYGESEKILGETLPADWRPRIVTKTPPIQEEDVTAAAAECVYEAALRSVDLIGRPLYGLLVHHGRDLLKPGADRLVEALARLKDDGVTRLVGVSVYTSDEIDAILSGFTPDIVQLPYNLCDRRLDDSGHMDELARSNVEIHVRSVFLQGLLLTPPTLLPAYFSPLLPVLERLSADYGDGTIDRMAACLGAVALRPAIDTAVVGVTQPDELRTILEAAEKAPEIALDPEQFRVDHPGMLDPSTWPPREFLNAAS